MIKYLRTLGFNVVNNVLADNSWYFRNALVRAKLQRLDSRYYRDNHLFGKLFP